MFSPLLDTETIVFTQLFACDGAKPLNYCIFLHCLNRFFVFMNAKDHGIYMYLCRFLPSDSAKCCKLQHFVRCLCSIFKHAMLAYVLCILPQETTLRCRLKLEDGVTRKEAEGRRRTEAFTHTGAFTQRSLYTQELFTHRRFYTEKSLLQVPFVHKHLGAFTHSKLLHHFTPTGAFTQRSLYTEELFTHRRFCTFCTQTSRSFYTQKLLHKEVFTQIALTHGRVYTQKLLHREAFTQRVFIHGSFYTQ